MGKIKILMLIKPFYRDRPKHKNKFDTIRAIEEFAEVKYWYSDGDIFDIISKLEFTPDFIFHYDISWGFVFAPKVTGLDRISIPKCCYVIDTHWNKNSRIDYFESNKIDMIFSATQDSFYKFYPKYIDKHRWLPFSINPDIIKDYGLNKTIDFLLMGLMYVDSNKLKKYHPLASSGKGKYMFREAILNKMDGMPGFLYIPHPGHNTPFSDSLMVNENYARQINEASIFFTCGGLRECPVIKYFEVPGCKTLLLAKPNRDILDLGFKDGVNFVACDESDFYDKAIYYKNNSKLRAEITNRGYEFIHSNHTNSIRAKQFIAYLEEFRK